MVEINYKKIDEVSQSKIEMYTKCVAWRKIMDKNKIIIEKNQF